MWWGNGLWGLRRLLYKDVAGRIPSIERGSPKQLVHAKFNVSHEVLSPKTFLSSGECCGSARGCIVSLVRDTYETRASSRVDIGTFSHSTIASRQRTSNDQKEDTLRKHLPRKIITGLACRHSPTRVKVPM